MNVLSEKTSCFARAFTLFELMIVVVIIGIAGLLAVPMVSSGADFQIRAAANIIIADLEYAKNLAITNQENISVVFDDSNETYIMQDSTDTAIADPVRSGSTISVDFANDGRFGSVDITKVSFDGTDTVTFDYLGCPFNGSSNTLGEGEIVLVAGDNTMTIVVEPITGYVEINN